jgi:predicted transposase/invertase (TIGR01784 family)
VKEPTFRIDGVFLPPDDVASKLIFFVEVQMQKDGSLYNRFFAESMLYLHRNPICDDWYGVVLLKSRRIEPKNTMLHRSLLDGPQVQRIYLDESEDSESQSIGLQLIHCNPGNSETDAKSGKAID